MTPTLEVLDYLRIIMFPLCALGFIVSAIYEYQNSKSRLRLAIMLTTALAMLAWMIVSLTIIYNPSLTDPVRHYAVTPIITILTALIWVYALMRVHLCSRKYNKQEKGGCYDGNEVQ